jgi:ABC-type sugar transport system ATPase subunit
MAEVVKALVHDVRVIALDEPTSSLSSTEAEQLFRVVDRLRSQGVAVIYVSTGWTKCSGWVTSSRSCATEQ